MGVVATTRCGSPKETEERRTVTRARPLEIAPSVRRAQARLVPKHNAAGSPVPLQGRDPRLGRHPDWVSFLVLGPSARPPVRLQKGVKSQDVV